MSIRYWDDGAGTGNFGTAANWSADTAPIASDDAWIEQGTTAINSGLGTFAAVAFNRFAVGSGFTGSLGDVSAGAFAPTYAQILASYIDIGIWEKSGSQPNGSSRLLIDAQTTAAQIRVFQTPTSGADSSLEPVRLLANNSSTDIVVLGRALVGLATSNPAETSTIGDARTTSSQAQLALGSGVTVTNVYADAGTVRMGGVATTIEILDGTVNVLAEAGTITTAKVLGNGTLDLSGSGCTVTNAIELADGARLDLRGFVGTLSGGIKLTGSGAATILADPNQSF